MNGYINWTKADSKGLYFPSDFGWNDCLGTMEYYKRLKQKNDERMRKMRKKEQKNEEKKEDLFKGLDEMERKILMMNRWERKSVQQIAQELNILEDLVKEHLKSARMKTRQNMMSNGN